MSLRTLCINSVQSETTIIYFRNLWFFPSCLWLQLANGIFILTVYRFKNTLLSFTCCHHYFLYHYRSHYIHNYRYLFYTTVTDFPFQLVHNFSHKISLSPDAQLLLNKPVQTVEKGSGKAASFKQLSGLLLFEGEQVYSATLSQYTIQHHFPLSSLYLPKIQFNNFCTNPQCGCNP